MKSRWIACLVLGLASAVRADALVEGPSVVPIGSLVVLKANAQSEKVGWLVMEPNNLEFRLFGQTFVCSAGCVPAEIVIVCVDWEGQVLEKHLVIVGKPTPPDPDPDPDPPPPDPDVIPPDKFDNIGQAAFRWAKELFDAKSIAVSQKMADDYADVAEKLEHGSIINITQAAEELRRRRGLVLTEQSQKDQYGAWGARIEEVFAKFRPVNREDMILLYRQVGRALGELD